MSHAELENTLRNLRGIGTRLDDPLRDDAGPQVWRFEHDGKPYRLHFYARTVGGNRALRELQAFQLVQKAGIPSPRAISAMVGFRLGDQRGDALLLESIEPAITLEQFLVICELTGEPIRGRATLRGHVIEICQQLAKAGLGHDHLDLTGFAVRDDQLYLVRATGIRRGGLTVRQLMRLARSAAPFATRSDHVRAAIVLGTENVDLAKYLHSRPFFRSATRKVFRDNGDFGTLRIGEWSGVFTRRTSHPLGWASASQQTFDRATWDKAWPELLSRIRNRRLETIKDDPSGAVMRGTIHLNQANFNVVVKSPRRKFWRQTLGEWVRPSRARRTWLRTFQMLLRGLPCEWPMLLMERRRAGFPVESFLVFEEVPGTTLASVDLDGIAARDRENLFRRAGRALRQIEEFGFTHGDAKSTNWIVYHDAARGPRPILIDLYGVRNHRWGLLGITRLLRAMRQHPQYTPTDSKHLCLGYAPHAKLACE